MQFNTSAVRPDVRAQRRSTCPILVKQTRGACCGCLPSVDVHETPQRTTKRDAFRGLVPDSPVFLTDDVEPYSLIKLTQPSGLLSYSCNTLGAYISRLQTNSGIKGGSAESARRTLAVKLTRKGYDLVHIATILGHKSVSTTKQLVMQDP